MKMIVTGSLGNISKPLAIELVEKGHEVRVISSQPGRQQEIEAIGAKAAIGSMLDPDFLTDVFKGADAIYIMEALGTGSFFNHDFNLLEEMNKIAYSYKKAIEQSGVKNVVHLSSIGAHTNKGNGILTFHYNVEKILEQLPEDVCIKTMRPVGFYYNMLEFIHTIKAQGTIVTNYNAAYREPWVAPADIAAVVAEEMERPFEGRTVRYIASDEKTSDEIATILGEAIGKPDLKWVAIGDEEQLKRMIAAGMNPETAKGLVEMNAARHTGELIEDYNLHKPVLGKTKIRDFAKQFAAVYHQ